MQEDIFIFLSDKYFQDFVDANLMRNKEVRNGVVHGRPCFYTLSYNDGIFWVVPISSQVEKYRAVYANKMTRYGRCDTIVFGDVLGFERAFLIQNMCPITAEYIESVYTTTGNTAVQVQKILSDELHTKAASVLAMQRQGKKLIFPDVLAIEQRLKSNKK